MKVRRIRKRDGRETPYDRRKIESAVSRAEAAVGEIRPGFAAEIGDLVERLLQRRFPDPELAIPGIEDIQDLVERALVEMGAAEAAKAYILYREKRSQIRAALLVRDSREEARGGAPRGPRTPRVEARDGVEAWSKGRIVAALMSEADLPRASAEDVAARVEARVFASGSKSISTALVREMVDNELVELGYEGALRRQRPIGLPRHDLRRALLDPTARPSSGPGVEELVSGEILSRYAMEDLLPVYVAERVRSGDLDFEDLSRPHLPLALALPLDALPAGERGAAAAALLLPEIGGLSRRVARRLSLENGELLIADLARSPRGGSALASWLAGLAAVTQASGRTIELVLHRPRLAALEPLVVALARLQREDGQGGLPRLVVDRPDWSDASPSARDASGRLLAKGLLFASWSSEPDRYAGSGLSRSAGERGARSLAAAATVDLPRIARRAGAWREDAVFEAAVEVLEVALDGLAALRDFQRESRDPSAPRARETFAVSPVGLGEALAILGDGDLRADQAARLLAFLGEAGERLAQARGLQVVVAPLYGERSARRFARLDAAQFRVRQPWLFAGPEPADPAGEASYSTGFEIPDEAALLGALGAVVTSALHPATALRRLGLVRDPGAREDGARWLEAWESLHRLRGRSRGSAHALYALPAVFRAAAPAETDLEPPLADLFASPVPGSPADP